MNFGWEFSQRKTLWWKVVKEGWVTRRDNCNAALSLSGKRRGASLIWKAMCRLLQDSDWNKKLIGRLHRNIYIYKEVIGK